MCGCAQSFEFDPDFSDDGEFEFGISNPGSPYYPDYDPNFIANSPSSQELEWGLKWDLNSYSSDSLESSCSDSSEQRRYLARQWSEEHPVAASSSAANAMFSEYLKVVRAKRAGTFVSYEDAN